MHLNEDLFERYQAGDPVAARIHALLGEVVEPLAELSVMGVCPGCIVNHVEELIGDDQLLHDPPHAA